MPSAGRVALDREVSVITPPPLGHDPCMRLAWLVAVAATACGGDGDGGAPDAGPVEDGAVDGSTDAAVDGPIDAAIDASPFDAPPDADPDATVISTVATDAGFTQICHSCIEVLVIRGANLQGTTAVRVGSIDALIRTVTATEIRAKVRIPDGFPPGALDVSIDGSFGTVMAPGAIEVTFVTAAANAPLAGGHGVPQSPIHLCDPELSISLCTPDAELGACPHAPLAGSTLHVRAGTHVCDGSFPSSGITVAGDGAATTIVESAGTFAIVLDDRAAPFDATSKVRDLRFAGTPTVGSLAFSRGHYELASIVDNGGISASESDSITISNYTFVGAPTRVALDLTPVDGGRVSIASTSIASCREGLSLKLANRFASASLTMSSTRIERCTVGVHLGSTPSSLSATDPSFDIADLQLHDNVTGVLEDAGSGTLRRVSITDDEATAPADTTGVAVNNGDALFVGGRIEGQTFGVRLVANVDHFPRVGTDGLEILRGSVGIASSAFGDSPGVSMRRTIMHDLSRCVLITGDEGGYNFGSTANPGQNSLSGGIAIDDRRTDVVSGGFADAVGTTLNGNSYDGQLFQGPISVGNDLRLADPEVSWQF
ncbi:MAG TPA: hypothetical protein VFQ53_19185 [Kofleriaceae bacterium]|nr:hypothetical protein [Kofleriaceae bacterium]